jgi:hypothetical protein
VKNLVSKGNYQLIAILAQRKVKVMEKGKEALSPLGDR